MHRLCITACADLRTIAPVIELAIKGLLSGVLVVAAVEASKRSPVAGAILVSLPLVSMIALAILYYDTRDTEQVIDLSWAIMWIVVPSIAFFIALPLYLQTSMPFWMSFTAATATMVAVYAAYAALLTRFGVPLA